MMATFGTGVAVTFWILFSGMILTMTDNKFTHWIAWRRRRPVKHDWMTWKEFHLRLAIWREDRPKGR